MLLRNGFILTMLALLWANCQKVPQIETVEITTPEGYIERYERRLSDYAKEGLYQKIDPEGKLVEEATYRADTLHGQRILYYENKDTQVVESYRMGVFEGVYRVYYPGGRIKLAGQYTANEMTGLWRGFYENGTLKEEVTFEHNQENGPFTEYYANGQLKAQGSYLDGDNEHGELKLYDETGRHYRTMSCEKGICQTIWDATKTVN